MGFGDYRNKEDEEDDVNSIASLRREQQLRDEEKAKDNDFSRFGAVASFGSQIGFGGEDGKGADYKDTNLSKTKLGKFGEGTYDGIMGETGVKGTLDDYFKERNKEGYEDRDTSRKLLDTEIAFGKGFIQVAEAPFKGAFNAFAGDLDIDEDSVVGKFGDAITKTDKYFGEGIDGILKEQTGEGLSDFSKKHVGGVIVEGGLIGGGEALFKGVGSTSKVVLKQTSKVVGKGVAKLSNKFKGKLNLTRKNSDELIKDVEEQIDKESSVFGMIDSDEIAVKLKETLARVDGDLVSNLREFGEANGLDVTKLVKKAEDINNRNFYEAKIFGKYVDDLDNSVSSYKEKQIKNKPIDNKKGTEYKLGTAVFDEDGIAIKSYVNKGEEVRLKSNNGDVIEGEVVNVVNANSSTNAKKGGVVNHIAEAGDNQMISIKLADGSIETVNIGAKASSKWNITSINESMSFPVKTPNKNIPKANRGEGDVGFDLNQLSSIIDEYKKITEGEIKQFNPQTLKFAEDRGLVKRVVNVAENEKGKIDGFTLTQKGYDLIQKSPLRNDNYIQGNLIKWKEKGIAQHYTDNYTKVSKNVDEGKASSSPELANLYEEHILNANVKAVDEGLLEIRAGMKEGLDNTLDAIININKSKKLGLDKLIEKAIDGADGDLEKLISAYANSKATGFISDKAFKNAVNKVNFGSSIGVTKRIMNSLGITNTKVSVKQILGDMKSSVAYRKLDTKIKNATDSLIKKGIKDKGEIVSLIKTLKHQQRAIKYETLAKNGAITQLKKEVIKDLRLKAREKGINSSVIDKFESRDYWKNAKNAKQFESAFNKIVNTMEEEYTKNLFSTIEKEFKNLAFVKNLNFKKNNTMDIKYAIELEHISKAFKSKTLGDINIADLEKILLKIKGFKNEGKDLFKRAKKEKQIEINAIRNKINESLQKKGPRKIFGIEVDEDPTGLKVVLDKMDKLDNTTLFQYRLIEKMFDDNPEAVKVFVYKIETAFNEFEKGELLTKNLAESILKELGDDPKKLSELGTILLARNIEHTDDGIFHSGLARQIYDKDKKSLFNTKLDKPLEMSDKPKWLDELDDFSDNLLNWDEIRKTELAVTLLEHDSKSNSKLLRIWDKFFDLQGARLKEVANRVDNSDVVINSKYSPFEIKDRNIEDLNYTIGEMGNVTNGHISKTGLNKRGQLSAVIKNGFTYENNPITLLLGQSRTSRYYVHMQEALKDAQRVYNGYGKTIKDMSVDELIAFKKTNKGATFSYSGKDVELHTGDINDIGEMKVSWKNELTNEIETKYAKIGKIDAIDGNGGIKNNLTKEERKRMDIFMTGVSQGGNRFLMESEKSIAKIANHFNSLPLLFNISSASKQPLSLIDAIPLVGLKNLISAGKDIYNDKALFKELEKRGAISARIQGGPDMNVREMAQRNLNQLGQTGTTRKLYTKYVEGGFLMLQTLDSRSYKNIWAGAYKKLLIENGVLEVGEKLTVRHLREGGELELELMAKADILANKSASTANPLFLPQAYRNAYNKMFVGLLTTQMNRMQNVYKMGPKLYKNGQYTELGILLSTNLTANYLDYLIGMEVGKALYGLGFESWEGYAQDQSDILWNKEVALRITFGQPLFLGKLGDLVAGDRLSPMLSGLARAGRQLGGIYDGISSGDIEMKEITDFLVTTVAGKGGKYIQNKVFE